MNLDDSNYTEKLRKSFWKEDEKNGGIIKRQYDEIKTVLSSNGLQWAERQLVKIKEHAIKETEFYKNYKINDVFPVMNKSKLIENYEACKAKAGFMTPLHISSTSGSTGTPFSVIQDYKKRSRTIADLKVFGELCNYPSHERMIFFRILNEKIHRTPEQEQRENIYYIDSSILDDSHLELMIRTIIEKKPRIIFSYSSTLVEISKYAIKKGYSAKDFTVKSVLCAGEGINEIDRQNMAELFGCKVYRRYSDMELGILGQDSGDGGKYILNYGSYYFECLKIDCDEPTKTGETGRIVITDLFNYAFPMIRYDTGDLGVMDYDGEVPVLTEIFGRDRDVIYTPEGVLISPAKISTSMWGIDELKQWQFIQNGKNEYTIKLNGNDNLDSTYILQKLRNLLGNNAILHVVKVNEIPVLSSNKRRAIINEYFND